ncbi:MAG: hybrid sensor histidine kinase/response regulator, partial [Candidatus Obscuribacterales bacterium]
MTLQFCDTADDQEDTFVDLALMTGRARRLYEERHRELYERTDKWFASLIVVEWLASIAVALLVSPLAWSGTRSYIHPHIWFAILMGGVFILPVIYCVSFMPGKTLTRHVIAVNQMLFSALLIHLTGGRIETHFHIFGSLAFLAFYRDWRVLITASLVVLIDHLLRGIFIPQSVYGVLSASPWRSMEHAGWVIFEDVFLIKACLQNQNEMMMAARRQDQVESAGEELGALAEERSRLLQAIEAKYLSLCDVSPVGIFQNASDGRCLYVNRR